MFSSSALDAIICNKIQDEMANKNILLRIKVKQVQNSIQSKVHLFAKETEPFLR